MTKLSIFIFTLLALASLSNSYLLFLQDTLAVWNTWKHKYHKVYDLAEEDARFTIFTQNYAQVQDNNKKNTGFKMALNEFADLTDQEFSDRYIQNGFRLDEARDVIEDDEDVQFEFLPADLPKSWDWREKGAVTAVKNQGQCGSCWAFSATGALEGLYFNQNNKLLSFSEQQLVDCDKQDHGCNGGLPWNAFGYAADGLETEEDYPYVGRKESSCQYDKSKGVKFVKGYKEVAPNDPEALKAAAVGQTVSVGIQADQLAFRLYKSGVLPATSKCGNKLNHGVLVVGYDLTDGVEGFIVKNSWSSVWGDGGYIRLSTDGKANNGTGVCGILSAATYPTA